ncbi:MAG: glycoside hydrolase family 2 TIM barrel-domain containing protein [Gammaproteobacteria bacterium]
MRIVREANGDFALLRNGKPYFIRGGGGWTFLDELVAAGGNSIRTWGDEKNDPVAFDEAQRHNLTVTAGLWLPHAKEGFDYADPEQVRQLIARMRAYVQRYRSHPALLLWGVGNEMETGAEADPNVWKAVEAVAAMVHEVDPHHPTITALAEISEAKLESLRKYCPSIDALGVNSYASLLSLPERLRQFGWRKPYLLTEFGPAGPWGQVPVTSWNAPLEPTSTEKADFYYQAYQKAVASAKGRALGSYVYFWGIEPTIVVTHTWYETFLPGSHERLGAVEALTQAWRGKPPPNRAPRLRALHSSADRERVAPGSAHTALVDVDDPDGDPVSVRWEVRSESTAMTGLPPPVIPDCIDKGEALAVTFSAPREPGAYRLFVYVSDGRGNAATANVPFMVTTNALTFHTAKQRELAIP